MMMKQFERKFVTLLLNWREILWVKYKLNFGGDHCFRRRSDENDQSQWPEVMEFLFQSANSTHPSLKESALIIFE